jgi:DNA-binding NarL/FixJ family response regulator
VPSSLPPARAARVLIADDDRLFAQALMTALSEDERFDVVGIAEGGQEAVELAAALRPDVILMDFKMPAVDGLEATRQIRARGLETEILILSGTDEETGSKHAAAAGANSYLRKETDLKELKDVVLEVASLAAVLAHKSRHRR